MRGYRGERGVCRGGDTLQGASRGVQSLGKGPGSARPRGRPMSTHHFHCTDGKDMILDRRGRRVGDDEVELCARLTAGHLMSRLPGYGEWSSWIVAVHDEEGRSVATLR